MAIEHSGEAVQVGRYKHFKGGEYYVIGSATHSETGEQLIVYRALYGEQGLWARPYSMFFSKVEVNGALTSRFMYCGD